MIQIFEIFVLIFSAVAHEYMHGWMADRLGDPTAKNAGRLTLNPLPHLDWFGSIVLPLLLVISGSGAILGWAKPVPYNPYNLRDKKWGEAKVALAGPLANLVIALTFGLLLRFLPFISLTFNGLLQVIVYINLILMVFNLVPLPPLDGSKILASFLSPRARYHYLALEKYGLILLVILAFWGFQWLLPLIDGLFNLIVG
jgi:Zn-dependent protease